MGTTLDNGIYLPDEGERNCYEGLAGNWVALDNHLGSTNIHVTINDKQAWNGKQDALSQTQLDAVNSGIDSTKVQQIATNTSDISSLQSGKANDSDVVHKSGSETVAGLKTFSDGFSVNKPSPRLQTRSTTYSSETSSAMVIGDIAFQNKNGNFSAWIVHQLKNDLTTRLCFRVYPYGSSLDTTYKGLAFDERCTLYPENYNSALGTSTNKWKTFNGLEPSSLSLPSGNPDDFIDISSYFANTGSGDTNTYTALANGWIYLRLGNISSCQVVLNDSSNRRLWGTSATGNVEQIMMPILKNTTLTTTWVTNSTVVNVATARFIPCQGSV